MTTATPRLMGDDLIAMLGLLEGANSAELKLTVPDEAHRSTLVSLGVDPLGAQIRQVFFFDTPDLALNEAGVVARARRIQGRNGDSVVKLRPVVPSELPDGVRRSPAFSVEVDAALLSPAAFSSAARVASDAVPMSPAATNTVTAQLDRRMRCPFRR